MRFIIILIIVVSLLSGCSNAGFPPGMYAYEPDSNTVRDLHVDFPYFMSEEERVAEARVIAEVILEKITYIKFSDEEHSISEQDGIYYDLKVKDLYYKENGPAADGKRLKVYVFYEYSFENIPSPDLKEGETYIVFLSSLDADAPSILSDFFDYYLISDFRNYKIDPTKSNVARIKELVKQIK